MIDKVCKKAILIFKLNFIQRLRKLIYLTVQRRKVSKKGKRWDPLWPSTRALVARGIDSVGQSITVIRFLRLAYWPNFFLLRGKWRWLWAEKKKNGTFLFQLCCRLQSWFQRLQIFLTFLTFSANLVFFLLNFKKHQIRQKKKPDFVEFFYKANNPVRDVIRYLPLLS